MATVSSATTAPPRRSPLRSSTVIAASVAAAYTLSFGVQVAAAAAFGAGPAMDAYFLAFGVANAASLVAAQTVSFEFVPYLVPRAGESTLDPGRSSGALVLAVLSGILVALIGVASAGLQVQVLSGGGWEVQRAAEAERIARLCWVYTGLYLALSTLDAMHHARRSYLVPGLALSGPYLGMIAGIVVLGGAIGPRALAVGLLGGGIATLPLRLVSLPRPLLDWSGVRQAFGFARDLARRLPLATLGVAVLCLGPAIDTFWAPRLGPAQLSYLAYATRLTIVLSSLVVLLPSVVLMPRFVGALASGDRNRFVRDVGSALRIVAFVIVPLVAAAVLLRRPVIALVFQRGDFDAVAVDGVSRAIGWLLVSLVPQVALIVLFRALFADRATGAAARVGLTVLVLHFTMSGLLSRYLGLHGIGLSYVLSWSVGVILAVGAVVGRVGLVRELVALGRTLGASAVCSLAAGGVVVLIGALAHGVLEGVSRTARDALSGGVGVLVFTFVFLIMAYRVVRAREAAWLLERWRQGTPS